MADSITLEQAMTGTPVWMSVYVAEPLREIEVKMTYTELMAIKIVWDNHLNNKWMPINVPPAEGDWIIVVVPNIHMKYYYMACKYEGKFLSDVIAWMPLHEYEVNNEINNDD